MDSGKTENSSRLSDELKTRSVHDTIIDEAKITLSTIQHAPLSPLTLRESREAEPARLHSLTNAMELSKTEEKAMDALVNLAFAAPTLQTRLASLTEAQKEQKEQKEGAVKRSEPEGRKDDEGEVAEKSEKGETTEEEKTEEEKQEEKEKRDGWPEEKD